MDFERDRGWPLRGHGFAQRGEASGFRIRIAALASVCLRRVAPEGQKENSIMSNKVIADLQQKLRKAHGEVLSIDLRKDTFKRELSKNEQELRARLVEEASNLQERIDALETIARQDAEAGANVEKLGLFSGDKEERKVGGGHVTDAQIYRPEGRSWVKDLVEVKFNKSGMWDAADRLRRNNLMVAEQRASDGITTGLGDGGEFVPPLWAVDQYVKFLRAGRVFADRQTQQKLPTGTDSINLPKITGGTQVAAQATQNTGVNVLDITTSSVSSSVVTLAGGQTVSLQLLEQSPVNVDEVILTDLGEDYAKQLDLAVLAGAGTSGTLKGVTAQSGIISVSFTGSTVQAFYSKMAGAIASMQAVRFLPPTSITMHPRRWSWILAAVDNQSRPLVVPRAQGPFNALAEGGASVAEGYAGDLLGVPVFVDPNVPTNLNTNQDQVILGRMEDNVLYEGSLKAEAFPQTYASNLSLFIRLYNYAALVSRYPEAVVVIGGSGLATPTF